MAGNVDLTPKVSLAVMRFFGNVAYLKDELDRLVELDYRITIFAVYEKLPAAAEPSVADILRTGNDIVAAG